jgi:hypothetical protein
VRLQRGASSGLPGYPAPARPPRHGARIEASRLRAAGPPGHLPRWRRAPHCDRRRSWPQRRDRRRSAMRNARLCRLLAEQGADVVCATISLFHEVQRWNRENIPGYREIYLRVPIDELRRRDSKGIYAGAQRGDARNVVGLDVPAEAPERRTWSSTIMGRSTLPRRSTASWRYAPGGIRVRRSRRASSPSKRRRKLGSAGAAAAQCTRLATGPILGWRLALGRRWRARRRRRCALGFRSGHRAQQCTGEDGAERTLRPGRYDSVLGIAGSAAVAQAIERVIDSFADDGSDDDQIFVQPMLDRVAMAGVAFSRNPSGGPISLSIMTTVPA